MAERCHKDAVKKELEGFGRLLGYRALHKKKVRIQSSTPQAISISLVKSTEVHMYPTLALYLLVW